MAYAYPLSLVRPAIKVVVVFYLSIHVQMVFSQAHPKAISYYQKAQKELAKKNIEKATSLLDKSLAFDPNYIEAHLSLYRIYLDQERYDNALKHVGTASALVSKDQPNLLFNAGKLAIQIGDYNSTKKYLTQYLALKSKDTVTRKKATHYIQTAEYATMNLSSPVPYEPKSLGPSINTEIPEYLPSINGMNTTLVFTRRAKGQEDLWISNRADKNTAWGPSKAWPQNTSSNEGAHMISADGKTMMFTRCGGSDGYGSCDLYSSEWRTSTWSKPINIGPNINTNAWESQPALSANGKLLYFVSDRAGGFGGYDIWMSRKTTKGWGKPENAGANINTSWDELSPFIHPDDRHLYFRSNGWQGYGSIDLFVSTKETGEYWSTPINLGYPLNDHQDQGAMVVALDGKTAILTHQKINLQNQLLSSDLVEIQLPPFASSSDCIFLNGKVKNAMTSEPIAKASITILDAELGRIRDTLYSDRDGEFLIIVPRNRVYQIIGQADSFDFFSDRLTIAEHISGRYQYDMLLNKVITNNAFVLDKPRVLKNVLFEFGSSKLLAESTHELDVLYHFLRSNPTLKATIDGHTDNIGTPEKNKILSIDRARQVNDYLISKQIHFDRLTYRGFGDQVPLVTNTTEENRAINRRVEIKLSK